MSQTAEVAVFLVLILFTAGGTTPALGQTQCTFAGELKIAPQVIIQDSDPTLGNPSADVLLTEFLDPNCSHCQRIHSSVKEVVDEFGDQIRYFALTIPVWKYSARQIEAIFLAKEKGKYYEMIDQQLKNSQQGELSIARLGALADSIGIDAEWMRSQLTQKASRKEVGRASFMAQKAGIENIPTLAIGRNVISPEQPTSCIARLVERTLQERTGEGN